MQIAIVEDERDYAQTLQNYLGRYAQEYDQRLDVTCYQDGLSFLDSFKSQFDVILLDIAMPGIDGMETAKCIRRQDSDVVIVFVTNLAQYAIRGYEVDALDYILKPISYFAFSQRLTRAIGRIKNRTKHYIVITVRGKTQKLDVDTILYVESQGHNLMIHTESDVYTLSGTMKEMEERLAPYHFFRCNKGYLVALQHVDSVQNGCAIVRGEPLLISRARKNEFMEALTNFVGGMML